MSKVNTKLPNTVDEFSFIAEVPWRSLSLTFFAALCGEQGLDLKTSYDKCHDGKARVVAYFNNSGQVVCWKLLFCD
jgi:hypothetical protein